MPCKSYSHNVLLPLLAVLFSINLLQAQTVSNQSGFYPVDSLFFTVKQEAPKGGKIQISVNCFTQAQCFSDYKGGVWLYDRSKTPNSWEDQQLSRAPTNASDTLAHRGFLDKVNVVCVRVLDGKGGVESDNAYFIGVTGKGSQYPYSLPVVQLLVDSLDAFGPQGFYGPGQGIKTQYINAWNYDLDQSGVYRSFVPLARVEKPCIIQVVDHDKPSLLYQQCGLHLAARLPHNLPNKGLEVTARKEYSASATLSTDLIENKKTDYHAISLVTGQGSGFAADAIGERIFEGLNIGESRIKPVVTFLNGSYWSLSFAERDIAEDLSHDGVSILRPQYFVRDAKFIGILHNLQIDSQNIAWTHAPDGKVVGTGLLEHGKKGAFASVSTKLLAAAEGKPLSYNELDALVDLNSWLTYIAAVDFGHINSSIQHHVLLCTAPGKKMFVLMDEVKDFAMADQAQNFWKDKILTPDDPNEKTFASTLIKDVILKNSKCIEKLCRRYEDLLNTNFKADKTVPIIEKLAKEFMPEYGRYHRSWSPNGGLDSTAEADVLESAKQYCTARPDVAWQQLADQWLPDSKYHLTDRRTVNVVLDSIPAGTAKVHVNSLELTKSWSGVYYPNPSLEISLEGLNVPAGYVLGWKEYADKPLAFNLPLQNEITLTPVLRPAKK